MNSTEVFIFIRLFSVGILTLTALSLVPAGIAVIIAGLKTGKDKKLSLIVGIGLIVLAVIAAVGMVMILPDSSDMERLDRFLRRLNK